jgi:hypothetical protein
MNNINEIASHLEALERLLLEPSVRRTARVAELLADEFIEIGSGGGSHTREEILTALQEESATRWAVREFSVRLFSADLALVTYRALRHSTPPVHSLRSSIWQRSGSAWQMAFHQATLSSPERDSRPA